MYLALFLLIVCLPLFVIIWVAGDWDASSYYWPIPFMLAFFLGSIEMILADHILGLSDRGIWPPLPVGIVNLAVSATYLYHRRHDL